MIAVSVEPQRAWLENIVGDRYKIVTVLPNGVNLETYEPSMQTRKDLDEADVYFMIGTLLVESNLKMSSKDTARFVNTSTGVQHIYGTHNGCPDHRSFLPSENDMTPDPHIWTSVPNARIMTKNMTEYLKSIDPENAQVYQENFERYDAHLDSLNTEYKAALDTINSRSFMVWHPSLSYFARDYGLNQIAVGTESKETSMQSLKHVIDHAIGDHVKVFFHQQDYDSRQAGSINGSVGSRLVSINLGDYSWEEQLDSIVSELANQ